MLIIRNPWGKHYYNSTWSAKDSNWTPDLIRQVPYGIDPTDKTTGIFVAPVEALFRGKCFEALSISHVRQGYEDTWYDRINDDGQYSAYQFVSNTDSHIYVTVETYSYSIVPEKCTTNNYSILPLAYFSVSKKQWWWSQTLTRKYYADATHDPYMIHMISMIHDLPLMAHCNVSMICLAMV